MSSCDRQPYLGQALWKPLSTGSGVPSRHTPEESAVSLTGPKAASPLAWHDGRYTQQDTSLGAQPALSLGWARAVGHTPKGPSATLVLGGGSSTLLKSTRQLRATNLINNEIS